MNKILIKLAVWLLKQVAQDKVVYNNSFNYFIDSIEQTELHE